MPPIVFSYETGRFGLFCQSMSCLLRLGRCLKMIPSFFQSDGESDVQKQKCSLIITVVYMIYLSAGVYMVIENFHPH
jgi:hypothetical protein